MRPGRTRAWWDNFLAEKVVPEEWKENFRMRKENFMKLCDELRPYMNCHEYENPSGSGETSSSYIVLLIR